MFARSVLWELGFSVYVYTSLFFSAILQRSTTLTLFHSEFGHSECNRVIDLLFVSQEEDRILPKNMKE